MRGQKCTNKYFWCGVAYCRVHNCRFNANKSREIFNESFAKLQNTENDEKNVVAVDENVETKKKTKKNGPISK